MKPNPRPTGSKWHRAWRCPASAVLPQNTDEDREARTEPARNRGKDIHAYLENVKRVGKDQALLDAPQELRFLLDAIDINALPTHLATEVAFAMDMRGGGRVRELGRNLGHRDYTSLPDPPHPRAELAFTMDAIGVQRTGTETIGYAGDYKAGRTKYPPPDEFGQTLLGGLAVMDAYDCDRVVLELIYIDEDGRSYPVRRVVDAWDMEAVRESFMAGWRAIDDNEVEYLTGRPLAANEGAHCTYCPAYKHCPAKVALVRSIPDTLTQMGVVRGEEGALEIARDAVSVRSAGEMFLAAERIIEVLNKIKTEICGLAYHEPIALPDGRVIERIVTNRRELDGRKAAAVLERRYGREEALTAIDLSVSIDAIKQLARKHMVKGEAMERKRGGGVLDLILKEIEADGGLANNQSESVKPHMPRRRLKP